MLNYECLCGNQLYFENTRCVQCGKEVGFAPATLAMTPIVPAGGGRFRALKTGGEKLVRLCSNYVQHHTCNWLIDDSDLDTLCFSCRFTSVIPNLEVPGNVDKWARIAGAIRRLFFTLLRLELPLRPRTEDPAQGLTFRLLADPATPDRAQGHVLTGHANGIITLNILEADDAARERARLELHETYRTVLGHLRHEIGHYYWSLLVDKTRWRSRFIEVFGDPSPDYASALKAYYSNGAPIDWPLHYVSAYASSHPWEDWAETWSHYLHIYDTLETAQDLGFNNIFREFKLPARLDTPFFDNMLASWASLSVMLNCLNRSLGLPDAYPFVIAKPVMHKLRFIHELILGAHAAKPETEPSHFDADRAPRTKVKCEPQPR